MRILFATTEAVPFCKTGGLGDVCGSLPLELANLGHQPVVILPAFRQALNSGQPIEPTGIRFEVPIGRKNVAGTFLRSILPGDKTPVYLIHQPQYYDRPELYRENGHDYKDNCERFVFFCRAALEAIQLLDLKTELVHCHDWPSGLIPAYLKTELCGVPPYDSIRSVMTIHNIAYQGSFWHWDMELTGIDWKYFNWRQMEYYGNLSFLKSGLAFADTLSTVSPRYADEIQHPPLGCGLEGILQHRRADLYGIMNGVDYRQWNPETDRFLGGHNYGVETVAEGKAACKAALQREVGLPLVPDQPLVAMVGRLVDQKGFDLVAKLIPQLAPNSTIQWVILGTGEPQYHQLLSDLAKQYPDKLAVRLSFSDELAHRIEAGADIFLMPSRYEPCGLNQLYSLKYGTVPVVHATGGLADSITNANDATLENGTANGFSFATYTTAALAASLEQACECFKNRPIWERLVRTGMSQDWSWNHSAREYDRLYKYTLAHATNAACG
ncbi:MAG TPA: glycogen synthase GlgA [Lacipirellulaceae bacterium]|nr:glycogen synthase GlgA [Lacipirellulaceae bacterium]